MDGQEFAHTIHNLFRSLIPTQNGEGDVMEDDMPSLEPIPITTSQSQPPSTQTASSNHSEVMNTTELQASTSGNDESDDLMPELQSVSDSSSEGSDSDRDANEVEMQTVEDDNDSSWTDEDVEMPIGVPTSTSAPRRSNRRARVDDDEDEERDRRHPSQRVGNAINNQSSNSTSSLPTPTPAAPQQLPHLPPPPLIPPPLPRIRATFNIPGFLGVGGGPDPFRIFRQRIFQGQARNTDQTNNTNAQQNPGNTPPNAGTQPMFGGFAITLDLNGTPILHHHTGQGGDVNQEDEMDALRNFINIFGLRSSFNEPEDPERAKRLVDGLEEVPVGLIRRLERVGGSTLAEESGGSGGDSGCAICWDRLLDGDGDGFGNAESAQNAENKDEVTSGAAAPTELNVDTGAPVEASSSSSPSTSSKPEYPKIVSLPCAHVFHASCLIPWFSRPMQTTCPTCRFNIDPENLTYSRRTAPPRSPPTTNVPNTNVPNTNAPNINPPNINFPTIDAARINARANAITTPLTSGMASALIAGLRLDGLFPTAPGTNAPEAATEGAPGPESAAARETAAQGGAEVPRRRERQVLYVPDPAAPAGPSSASSATDAHVENVFNVDSNLSGSNAAAEGATTPVPPETVPTATTTHDVPNGGTPAQPPPTNTQDANPTGRQNMFQPGFVTFGFDIIVGPPIAGMDMDGDMDMDSSDGGSPVGNDDIEQAWNDMLPEDEDLPTPPSSPGTNDRFRRFPHPMFPGMNAGPGVHIGAGAGGMINEAFASFFGGRGPGGAPMPQGTPANRESAPQPQPGTPANAAPAAQNGVAPDAGHEQRSDFVFAMFNGVPVPVPMAGGPPAPVNQGNNTANPNSNPNPNPGVRTAFNPMMFPPGFNLPPMNPGGAPPAAGGNIPADVPADGPTPTGPQTHNVLPPFANLFGPFPGPQPNPTPGQGNPRPQAQMPFMPGMPRPPRERKAWTLPPPPGPTLRQRVERKEREAGLRCHDVSCGVGPSDEEPLAGLAEDLTKQLAIRSQHPTNEGAVVCQHTFHSSCLVSSERVSLKGAEVNVIGGDVEVSCSICREVGCVSKVDWDEGVQALA